MDYIEELKKDWVFLDKMPFFWVFFTLFWFNRSMEPREWQKRKNKKIPVMVNEIANQAHVAEENLLASLTEKEVYDYMLSKLNFCQRKQMYSSLEAKVYLQIGDICFTDFGLAYLSEVGYQHFGLVLAMRHGKIFVVPMSGNYQAYQKAYNPKTKQGKRHLMRLPEIEGLNKSSVLFLNDAKWINSARVIDVKAHIDEDSLLFEKIKNLVLQMI